MLKALAPSAAGLARSVGTPCEADANRAQHRDRHPDARLAHAQHRGYAVAQHVDLPPGAHEGGSLLAGESGGVGDFLEGAGPWVADAVNVTAGGAVLQRTAGACVAACGEMLSGGAMSQAAFLAHLGEWSNPGALAEALNALEGVTTWEGGYFASAADAVLAAQAGPMGAVLQAPFLPAH